MEYTQMKQTIMVALMAVISFAFTPAQAEDIKEADKARLLAAVSEASQQWKDAFNRGDAAAAADLYEENAFMEAKPFGSFTGHSAILAFWENLVAGGYAEVEYLEPKITVLNARAAVLSSSWKMNNAHGIITKELWVLRDDGTAKLLVDEFEVQGTK